MVLGKSIAKLGREVKGWPAWASLRDRVDAFKRTMPLITDLRNPALRSRHWEQLVEHVGTRCVAAPAQPCTAAAVCCSLLELTVLCVHANSSPAPTPRKQQCPPTTFRVDPTSDSFTLDTVMTLRLDQHAEFIAELSTNASKELAIETSLQGIAATWAQLPLDLAEYKGTHKLRSTEDVRSCWADTHAVIDYC